MQRPTRRSPAGSRRSCAFAGIVLRTQRAIERSDLILCLLDRSEQLIGEDREILARAWGVPTILVVNKTDLPDRLGAVSPGRWNARIDVSARDGDGIEDLRKTILRLLTGGELPTRNTVLLLDAWERDLIRRVGESLRGAEETARGGHSVDMVTEDLRHAYRTTAELQGIDISESILDSIFSRFCVGK